MTKRKFPVVGVAIIVIDQKDHILLGKRAHGWGKGLWCIPCGKVEWGEEIREAAERELREETGLTAKAGPVVAVHSNFHDPEHLSVGIWFTGENIQGEAKTLDSELATLEWFPLSQTPELCYPTDRLVIKQLLDTIT